MPPTNSNQVVAFFRFIRLFGVSMISILRVCEKHVDAIVAWDDDCHDGIPDRDDVQNVRWEFTTSPQLNDALIVGEFAYDMGWIASDKVELDEMKLKSFLVWDEDRTKIAIETLFKLKVQMIDGGEKTDSFFLHN